MGLGSGVRYDWCLLLSRDSELSTGRNQVAIEELLNKSRKERKQGGKKEGKEEWREEETEGWKEGRMKENQGGRKIDLRNILTSFAQPLVLDLDSN